MHLFNNFIILECQLNVYPVLIVVKSYLLN